MNRVGDFFRVEPKVYCKESSKHKNSGKDWAENIQREILRLENTIVAIKQKIEYPKLINLLLKKEFELLTELNTLNEKLELLNLDNSVSHLVYDFMIEENGGKQPKRNFKMAYFVQRIR